jgi:hypothetical protein
VNRALAAGFVLAVLSSACLRDASTRAAAQPYVPLFRDAIDSARGHQAGTVAADFAQAAGAATLGDAAARFEAFLRKYPLSAEREDAFQGRYIEAARLELARVYYLLGRREDGDKLLRDVDPLARDLRRGDFTLAPFTSGHRWQERAEVLQPL